MSNTPIPNFVVTNCDFTYVNGNQTNYNHDYLDRGSRRFDRTAENPDPQTQSQDATGRNTRSEPSPAPLPPPSFAAYPQGPQQYPQEPQQYPQDPQQYPQEPQQHPFQHQSNYAYHPTMSSIPNAPIDRSRKPLPAPPTVNKSSYSRLPTTAPLPLSPPWAGSSVASTPQQSTSDLAVPHLTFSNGSQATPPIQTRGQNDHQRNKPKH